MSSLQELETDVREATSAPDFAGDSGGDGGGGDDGDESMTDRALERLAGIELQIDTLRRQTAAGRRYVECSVDGSAAASSASTSSSGGGDSASSSPRRRRRRILLRISNGVTTIIDVIEQALRKRAASPIGAIGSGGGGGGEASDLEALHTKLKAIESATEAEALDDDAPSPSFKPLQQPQPQQPQSPIVVADDEAPIERLLDESRAVKRALAIASSEHDYDESLRASAVSKQSIFCVADLAMCVKQAIFFLNGASIRT